MASNDNVDRVSVVVQVEILGVVQAIGEENEGRLSVETEVAATAVSWPNILHVKIWNGRVKGGIQINYRRTTVKQFRQSLSTTLLLDLEPKLTWQS